MKSCLIAILERIAMKAIHYLSTPKLVVYPQIGITQYVNGPNSTIISSYILIYFTYSFNTVDVFLNTLDIILIIKHYKLLINYVLSTF